jgi:hypothetical protein
MTRVFYASAKGANPAEIIDECSRIRALLSDVLGEEVKVVAAHEEWADSFASVGSWEGWTRQVATGRLFPSYEPRYHFFVAPSAYVGKATGQILQMALEDRKRVLLWPPNSMDPQQVERVEEEDPQNYTHGWHVVGTRDGDY